MSIVKSHTRAQAHNDQNSSCHTTFHFFFFSASCETAAHCFNSQRETTRSTVYLCMCTDIVKPYMIELITRRYTFSSAWMDQNYSSSNRYILHLLLIEKNPSTPPFLWKKKSHTWWMLIFFFISDFRTLHILLRHLSEKVWFCMEPCSTCAKFARLEDLLRRI